LPSLERRYHHNPALPSQQFSAPSRLGQRAEKITSTLFPTYSQRIRTYAVGIAYPAGLVQAVESGPDYPARL